jgi:hypothetical protein
MAAPDRLQLMLSQSIVTGIDFVYVHENQKVLDVYFLRAPETLDDPLIDPTTMAPDVTPAQIRIYSPSGGERLPEVGVTSVSGTVVDGRYVLRLVAAEPGDFTRYRLRLDDPRIDPYFVYATPTKKRVLRGHNDVSFSFKANCPSDLDCELPEHECALEASVDFPVDYLARDFWSFRHALLDFASQRYPDWPDRLEADAGVMLAEVMSALGDEMAYYQDRVAREAYLETATQRRSIRRHARLVDYTVHDGLAATTWLDVTASTDGSIPAGADVWALSDDGKRIVYEVGRGLGEVVNGTTYVVLAARSALEPHIWDEDDTCLPFGATEIYVKGHHKADLPLDDVTPGRPPGRWVLLRTDPVDPALPTHRWLVRLIAVEDRQDPLIDDPTTGNAITRLAWEQAQALPFEMDLTALVVRGNLVPATAGETITKRFIIGPTDDAQERPEAIEREGPGGSVTYLFSLPGSKARKLAWVGDVPRRAHPEIHLVELELQGGAWVEEETWEWRRSLLGTSSSQRYERHFTLDDGIWERVVGYRRIGKEIVHRDYATGAGITVRFGDGEFGLVPAQGTVFKVTYRLGDGRRSNVPADSITKFNASALSCVSAVANPLPVTSGLDPEPAYEVRQLAPEAFRTVTYRAVRPKDYAEAAERLAWVQRAGAAFRWTGSWLSAFVTPDPRGAVTVTDAQRAELRDQLDRFRQVGRETHVPDPRYANIDLEITICVEPHAYRGETKEAVLRALLGKKGVRLQVGFFSADNFTFGTPLNRSALEAAIQAVPGVRAVKGMKIRRRGWFDWRAFIGLAYKVGANEVIRLENDPLHPERGSLRLVMEGGA